MQRVFHLRLRSLNQTAGNGKPLNFIIQNDPFRGTFVEGNSLGYMGKRLELEENEVRKAS